MNHDQEMENSTQPNQTDAEQSELRAWSEPTFEKLTLREAMTATFSVYSFDGYSLYDVYYS